jgi:hypothetical protein
MKSFDDLSPVEFAFFRLARLVVEFGVSARFNVPAVFLVVRDLPDVDELDLVVLTGCDA